MERLGRARFEMFCVDSASNKRRRYLISLRPLEAIGEGYEVVLRWGRIADELTTRVQRFGTADAAWKLVRSVLKLRARHGYVVARVEPVEPLMSWIRAESFPFDPLPDDQPTLFDDLPPDEDDDDGQMNLF